MVIKLREIPESKYRSSDEVYRKGIRMDKGVTITGQWVEKNEDLLYKSWCLYAAYPDLFLDEITPVGSNFSLFPYQRLLLRSFMRYTTIFLTACRATSKTFLAILAKILQCIFLPGHVGSIVAPNKGQAAEIAKQKIDEILKIFPLLAKEFEDYGGEPHINKGKDYVECYFKNGSILKVVGTTDSARGLRTHATLLDEARDIDGDAIDQIILP